VKAGTEAILQELSSDLGGKLLICPPAFNNFGNFRRADHAGVYLG
jgi:hypothetical protein